MSSLATSYVRFEEVWLADWRWVDNIPVSWIYEADVIWFDINLIVVDVKAPWLGVPDR